MSWKCPSCSREKHDPFINCECGQSSKGAILMKQDLKDYQPDSEESVQYFYIPSDCKIDQAPLLQDPGKSSDAQDSESHDSPSSMPDEELIKEIDSWSVNFSRGDSCISIGTPALQSFRLKISLEDLEYLLEFLYQKTENEKTIRKLNLSVADVIGIIDQVDRLIEGKKSKVSINFTGDELREITDFINVQLKI